MHQVSAVHNEHVLEHDDKVVKIEKLGPLSLNTHWRRDQILIGHDTPTGQDCLVIAFLLQAAIIYIVIIKSGHSFGDGSSFDVFTVQQPGHLSKLAPLAGPSGLPSVSHRDIGQYTAVAFQDG
ncbi:hypothetical protein F5148DRAFT_1285943 [Russula earlei]|uniref:Uncharacterized protein n=1 Tax=Russula earlei TaxID=71964 RepID=A0ACC0U564_9AGAM|nr:hypothetical protein F5148DRAFT_1285943 [Russula earlei]